MKRNTLIILVSAYLVMVAVILLIAFCTKDKQPNRNSETKQFLNDEISVVDLSSTQHFALTNSESGNIYPDLDLAELENPELVEDYHKDEGLTTASELTVASLVPGTVSPTIITTVITKNPTSTPTRETSVYSTNTPTRTQTPTQTITPTPQIGWGGDWIVYFQQGDGTYVSGEININISGTNLIGSGMINSTNYSFEGRIISGGQSAIGNWTSPFDSGDFDWILISDNQFAGSRDIDFGLCGTRPGSIPPEPCYIPPLS